MTYIVVSFVLLSASSTWCALICIEFLFTSKHEGFETYVTLLFWGAIQAFLSGMTVLSARRGVQRYPALSTIVIRIGIAPVVVIPLVFAVAVVKSVVN